MSVEETRPDASAQNRAAMMTRELSATSQSIETALEAKEPPPPDVIKLCRETFQKTADYLKGELEATAEDYKLLEQMNKVTLSKYEEMKEITVNISKSLQVMNEKYKLLQPYLDQIDQIEESVTSLEQAAYRLDAYSKRLGLLAKGSMFPDYIKAVILSTGGTLSFQQTQVQAAGETVKC